MPNIAWLPVAGVYAAAVALARRFGVDLPKRVAALFYALVLLFLLDPLTGPYVNIPVDFLQTLPPWSHVVRRPHVINSEMNDLALQIVPWAHQVRESWKSLQVPLWNHLSGSGYPLLGNAQSSALSPLRLLALPLPLGQSFAAEAAMKLLIALTFTFLFCRRRNYSELASAIGAICFAFSSFVIVWLHFPLATVAVFLPAMLLQIDLLVERPTFARFAFTAAIVATMFFGGHPETVGHIFFFAAVYLLWILVVEGTHRSFRDARRSLLAIGGAIAVGALIATPFLATVLETLPRSKRFQELTAKPNAEVPFANRASTILLLQPHFYGDVPGEVAWGPARAESISGFAGILGVAGWFALLIRLVTRRGWRSRETFIVIAALLALGVCLAWPGVSDAFHLIFKLAANGRMRLLLCFLVAVLAAAAAEMLIRGESRPVLCGLLVASALLLYVMHSTPFPDAWKRDTALLSLVPSLAVILVAALASIAGRRRDVAVMFVATLVIGELWAVGRSWNAIVRDVQMYPRTPLIEVLQKLQKGRAPNDAFRIVGMDAAFFPNTPAVYGLEDIRAHDPMSNGGYLGVLRVLSGYDTSEYFAKWLNLDTTMLDFLNVRYVVTEPGATPHDGRFVLIYDARDGRIFENTAVMPRFFAVRNVVLELSRDAFVRRLRAASDWRLTAYLSRLPVENDRMRSDLFAPRPGDSPLATIEMLHATPREYRMRVRAPRYSVVVSSIPAWPGWIVERGGEAVEPLEANGAFLAFPVRPGVTDVRVYYTPLSFRVGGAVSVLTLLVLGGLGFRQLVHSRRQRRDG